MLQQIFTLMPYFGQQLACSKGSFLGLKPWYHYFPSDWFGVKTTVGGGVNSPCAINTNFQLFGNNGPSGFILIMLAILDDLVRIAALVSVGFIIYGGIQYITSQGSPDATKRAQQTIINALIGVVLSVIAVAIVSFIGNTLNK